MNNKSMFQMNSNWLVEPFRELVELNRDTLQSFEVVDPDELFSFKSPDELIEKNMRVVIQNSHKALDYMQGMFQIIEKNWFNIRDQVVEDSEEVINQAQKTTRQNSKKIFNMSEYAVGQKDSSSNSQKKEANHTRNSNSRSSTSGATKRSPTAQNKSSKKLDRKISSKSK